jgi:hypothetical protein
VAAAGGRLASLVMVAFAILPPKRLDNVLYDVLARANGRPADPRS